MVFAQASVVANQRAMHQSEIGSKLFVVMLVLQLALRMSVLAIPLSIVAPRLDSQRVCPLSKAIISTVPHSCTSPTKRPQRNAYLPP
jgi:hypothetical protein